MVHASDGGHAVFAATNVGKIAEILSPGNR
jgi:hypothetical protein